MGKPHSEDLRRSVVQAIEAGRTYEEVAELCGVSVSTVSRLLTRWRRSGSVSPEKFGGYKGYALEPYQERITQWVAAQPDAARTSGSPGEEQSDCQPDRNLPVSSPSGFHV